MTDNGEQGGDTHQPDAGPGRDHPWWFKLVNHVWSYGILYMVVGAVAAFALLTSPLQWAPWKHREWLAGTIHPLALELFLTLLIVYGGIQQVFTRKREQRAKIPLTRMHHFANIMDQDVQSLLLRSADRTKGVDRQAIAKRLGGEAKSLQGQNNSEDPLQQSLPSVEVHCADMRATLRKLSSVRDHLFADLRTTNIVAPESHLKNLNDVCHTEAQMHKEIEDDFYEHRDSKKRTEHGTPDKDTPEDCKLKQLVGPLEGYVFAIRDVSRQTASAIHKYHTWPEGRRRKRLEKIEHRQKRAASKKAVKSASDEPPDE